MKRFFTHLLVIYIGLNSSYAQSVGVGTPSPDPSAILDVSSSNQGFLPPRMTTIQRNAINNKAAGLVIYNTVTECIEMYNGSDWINFCSSLPSSVLVRTLLGGNQTEISNHMQQTADGGFILGGSTESSLSGDVSQANKGGTDCWVIKIGPTGVVEWDRVLGGAGFDEIKQIRQTNDGGYIFCASTESSQTGDIARINRGGIDMWIVKLNASGDTTWTALVGGDQPDLASSVHQTQDGGYIVGGYSFSSQSFDVTDASNGLSDYWVVKLNATGSVQWNNLLGGAGEEELYSLRPTADGGYIAAGSTTSSVSGNVTGSINGLFDFWIIKLNSAGNPIWNRSIGGNQEQRARSIALTADGGYIVAGRSTSSTSGNIVGTNNGLIDFLVVKLDAAGNVSWTRLLGGSAEETAFSVQQTADGGYILAGTSSSSSSGNITQASYGLEDIWVVKLDAGGNIVWQKLYGGNDSDHATTVQQTPDGGYIVAGYTASSANGSVIGTNHGGNDFWILKLDSLGNIL